MDLAAGSYYFLAIPSGNLLPSFSSVVLSLAWILNNFAMLTFNMRDIDAMIFIVYFGQLACQLASQFVEQST